jgi:hypothetical protein
MTYPPTGVASLCKLRWLPAHIGTRGFAGSTSRTKCPLPWLHRLVEAHI